MAEEQEAGVLDELPDGRGHHGEAEGEPHRRAPVVPRPVALVLLEHIEHAQPDEGEHRPAQAVNSVVVPWNAAVQPQGHPQVEGQQDENHQHHINEIGGLEVENPPVQGRDEQVQHGDEPHPRHPDPSGGQLIEPHDEGGQEEGQDYHPVGQLKPRRFFRHGRASFLRKGGDVVCLLLCPCLLAQSRCTRNFRETAARRRKKAEGGKIRPLSWLKREKPYGIIYHCLQFASFWGIVKDGLRMLP